MNCFLKMGQSRPHFCLFSTTISNQKLWTSAGFELGSSELEARMLTTWSPPQRPKHFMNPTRDKVTKKLLFRLGRNQVPMWPHCNLVELLLLITNISEAVFLSFSCHIKALPSFGTKDSRGSNCKEEQGKDDQYLFLLRSFNNQFWLISNNVQLTNIQIKKFMYIMYK